MAVKTHVWTGALAVLLLAAPVFGQRKIEGRQADLAQLVGRSEVIAVARVVEKRSDFVNGMIVTYYEMALEQSLLGRPGRRFTIALPGGQYGNLRTQWPGAPEPALNQRLVFFGGGDGALRPVGLFAGVVPVESDAANRDVVDMDDGRGELVADFLARVRGAIAARR